MDTKTLEYMGARVDKARELQKRIDDINNRMDKLENGELRSIAFGFRNISDFFADTPKIIKEIKAAAINAYCNHRDSLQKEFDEL